jgi:outer membrane protein TolC
MFCNVISLKNKDMKIIKLTSLMVLLFFNVNLVHAQELSLAQAAKYLETNNGNLNATKYAVEQKIYQAEKSKGLRLPTIGLEGNYTHINDDISIDLNPIRNVIAGLHQIPNPEGTLGSWKNVIQKQDFGNLNVSGKWPIYAGGKINIANNASKIQVEAARNKQEIKSDELYTSLIDLYYKTQLAAEALKVRKEVFEAIKLHEYNANKLFQNGIVAEVETLNAKVALSNAKREVLASQNDLSLAKAALKNLIGDVPFDRLTTPFISPTTLESLEKYQDIISKKYPQLKYLDNQIALTQLNIQKEKAGYLPEVAAFGKKYIYRNNVSILEPDWALGVGLKFNIFDGFQRRNNIKIAQFQAKEVEALEIQAKRSVNTFVENLYNEILKYKEQWESLQNDKDLANQLKFMRERAFKEGMGTSVEVIDATVQQSSVALKKAQALYQYNAKYGELSILLANSNEIFK